MGRGIGPVGAAGEHGDRRAVGREHGPVRGGVDSVGRATHHGEAAGGEAVTEVGRDAQPVVGGSSRAHDRDAPLDQGREVEPTAHEQAVRRPLQPVDARRATRRRRARAPAPGSARPHGPSRRGRARAAGPASRCGRRQPTGSQPLQRLDRPTRAQQVDTPSSSGSVRKAQAARAHRSSSSRRLEVRVARAHAATSSPLRSARPVATSSRPGTSRPARSAADHATRSTRS